MALCVDYALFFWSRFNKEREACAGVGSYNVAVTAALHRSGMRILTRNCFVTMAYACTMLLPHMNLWAYLGLYIECIVGCATAALYSVTVTPALAVVLPEIFDTVDCPLDNRQHQLWSGLPEPEAFWRRWAARITTSRPVMFAPLVAYPCMALLMYQLMRYQPSYDVEAMSLREDILEPQAYRQFQDCFNIGMINPVNLVLEAHPLPGISSPSAGSEAEAARLEEEEEVEEEEALAAQRPRRELAKGEAASAAAQRRPDAERRGLSEPLGRAGAARLARQTVLVQQRRAAVGEHGGGGARAGLLQLDERASHGSVKGAARGARSGPGQGRDEGQPITWQDVLRSDPASPPLDPADPLLARRLAVPRDTEGALSFWRRHRETAKKGVARSTNVAPAQCVSQQAAPGASRFAGGRDVAFSSEFGKEACALVGSLLAASGGTEWQIDGEDVLGLWWMPRMLNPSRSGPGFRVGGGEEGAPATKSGSLMRDELVARELLQRVPEVLRQSVSTDGNKVLLRVASRFRPSSRAAHELDSFVRVLERGDVGHFELGGRRYGMRLRHQSPMQAIVDADGALRQAALRMFGLFVPAVVFAAGMRFGSPFLMAKLVLTVVLPILTTYGLAISVYQMNVLGWTGITMLKGTGGLDYRLVAITGGVLFGFAIDYDLFLFARVRELRLEGYDPKSAVRRALVETGPVTTAAGAVMSFSFFFLAMARTPFVRIMGSILLVGTFLDTVLVRLVLAPAILTIAGSGAHWPLKMPPATKADEVSPPK
ncbi:unnamed protein product [Prorocentrum cordatum]|uniref:Membrane transport protein MMPL domain-containing protein n=1 Tax=Prorocentrum cordatum TaxID=2364126 RepID=A0ABN9S959_9DINO|nr:unnamed protein product [Polarella glacialis]